MLLQLCGRCASVWCSGGVGLPPALLIVFRMGQPSSHFPHGVQESSAFLLLPSWCSGWVSLPPTLPMVFRRGQPSSYPSHGAQDGSAFLPPIVVFWWDQPSNHSPHGVQDNSAFLPLLLWCSGWVSLPPTPHEVWGGSAPPTLSWCSEWVSLPPTPHDVWGGSAPPTPLMVLRMGQPSSHSIHGVQDGSALLPLLSWCSGWVSLPPTP